MSWVDAGLTALWVAALGQTGFVLLYATRPWWRHFVGRALFFKSATLAAVLWLTIVNHYLVYRYQLQVSVMLTWAVAVAICYQFTALVAQIRADRRP